MRFLGRLLAGLLPLVALFTISPARAQGSSGPTYVQLVLDASGSMYANLSDGRSRITAAKDVLTTLIGGLPDNAGLNVGLRIYGAEVRAGDPGACEDSKLFVPMQGLARPKLLETVRGVNAKGSTPIALSLTRAAADFPKTNDRKVIVLVTDGGETCGGKLAEVAAALKAAGIDLRIIGIDLPERVSNTLKDLGTFENVNSSAALFSALGRAVPAANQPQATLGVTVTLTRGGQPVTAGPTVRLQGALATADFPLNREATSGNFTGSVPAGAYTAVVDDALSNPSKVEFSGVTVAAGGRNAFSFDLAPVAAVNLTVSGAGPAGGFVTVTVANPPKLEQAGGRPFIALATSDSKIGDYLNWEYPPAEGNTVRLRTPDQPGKLEARYYVSQADGTTRLLGKSAAFETSTPKATVTAPASVQAGSRFEVAYANPSAASDDYLALVLEGDEGNLLSYEYVNADSKAVFNAPGKPGNYLIVYKLAQGESIARSGRVTVTPASATVTAPASVQAGQAFTVTYSGPESERNYIALYREGENQYLKYEYLNPNRSVSFNAPGEPGNYVAAFVLGEGDTVVARSGRISVTAARATVTAPATVTAGSKFTVRFSGPKNEGDFIGLHREGESSYLTWVYVTGEDSVEFTAPTQTGNYVMVYHLKEGEQAIATSARVTVTAATASVRAPASVKAGAEFTVTWTGPANQGDYVAISPENEPDADLDFDYVEAGKEVRLRAPEEPGNYIVLYALQDGTIIARVKVTVTR